YHLFLVLRVSLSDLLFLSSTHLFLTITTPSCSPLFPYTTLFRSVSRSEALEDLPLPSDLPPLEDLAAEPLDDRADEWPDSPRPRSEEHTSELQSRENLVCRLLLEKKINNKNFPQEQTNYNMLFSN